MALTPVPGVLRYSAPGSRDEEEFLVYSVVILILKRARHFSSSSSRRFSDPLWRRAPPAAADPSPCVIIVTSAARYHRFRQPPADQYAAVARLYRVDFDPHKLSQAFRVSFKQLEQEAPNFGAGSIGWQQWWLSLVSRTFTAADCQANTDTLNILGHHLIKHFSSGQAYELSDGSTALLEDIKGRGLLLGALSNSDERLDGILVRLGVRHYFDFVLTSYAARVAKPDPRIFQQALALAGGNIGSHEALHVGDDLQRDYLAARRCGWHGVLVSGQLQQLCQEAGVPLDAASMVTGLRDLHTLLDTFKQA